MTDETVTRLYRALVRELRRREHPANRPVTVADVYQTLVPYAAVRSTLGVELNADYEHALLRLLSGERDLVRLEPETAREALQREVNTPYPFVGLYRNFSSSPVWIAMPEPAERQERDDESTGVVRLTSGGPERAPEEAPVRLHRSEPTESVEPAPEPEPEPVTATAGAGPEAVSTPTGESLPGCTFCAAELPQGRRVRFCPHCGGDQRLQPCPRCDSVLERSWRYCINCGHVTGAD